MKMSKTGNWVFELQEQGLYDDDYSYNEWPENLEESEKNGVENESN